MLVPTPYWSAYITLPNRRLRLLLAIQASKSGRDRSHDVVCSLLIDDGFRNTDGFDFHLSLRARINIIGVSTPTLGETTTHALLPALRQAYDSAPDQAKIKALLFTNPNNPLGRCYSSSVIKDCMRFCQEREIHFVSDEVYALSIYQGIEEGWEADSEPFVSALALLGSERRDSGVEMEEKVENTKVDLSRVHVIWSLSKDLGSSGIRMVRRTLFQHVNAPTHSYLLNRFHRPGDWFRAI